MFSYIAFITHREEEKSIIIIMIEIRQTIPATIVVDLFT